MSSARLDAYCSCLRAGDAGVGRWNIIMLTNSKRDYRDCVFRYDEHMPETDDLTLVVLKGHLLIEELLVELGHLALPHAEYLDADRLSFHQLACVVRASVPRESDPAWELILSLNSLRNDLAHNLESSKRDARLQQIFQLDLQVQPNPDMLIDKSSDSSLDDAERLRHVVVDCMKFLLSIIFDYKGKKDDSE